jgi:uncharacterized repeat protein (TIGR01451 family)
MKTIIYITLIILSLSIVHAQELSYEGFLYHNKLFTYDNIAYTSLVSSNGQKLNLLSENNMLIDLGSCKKEIFKKFCFNSSVYDEDISNYKAYIYIYNLKPEIDITRSIDDNILEFGQTATFTVTLTNNGVVYAHNVEYFDDFPSNLEITKVKPGDNINNSVYWIGDIDIDETIELEYDVISHGTLDQYFKSTVKYFDGNNDIVEYSNQIRIYSDPVFVVTLDVDKEEYQINEDIIFTLTVTNSGDEDIDINKLNLIIPSNVQVEKSSRSFDEINGNYKLETEINVNDTKTYEFTLSGIDNGLTSIQLSGSYKYKKENYDIENDKVGFLLTNEGIDIETSLESSTSINSNELLLIYVRIKNNNEFSTIKNLKLQTLTDIAHFENRTLGSISINESAFILNTEIKAPNVDGEKSYPLKFNLTYETQDGKKFSEKIEKTIIVKPIKTLIISPTISKSSMYEFETTEIKIDLNNPGTDDLKAIEYNTKIPDIFKIQGATSAITNVNSTKSQNILTFNLIPNLVLNETNYYIEFTAYYVSKDKPYEINLTKKITVKPKIPDVSIVKTLESSSLYMGDTTDVTYIITNNDDVPVYDLTLFTTKDQYFDTINLFEKTIDKLDPGEKITIVGEQVRPKKQGTISAKNSELFYYDSNKRLFNKTINSNGVNVNFDTINDPALIVNITSNNTYANFNDKIKYILTLNNIGDQKALTTIKGDDNYITTLKSFEYNIVINTENEFRIPYVYYEYQYLDKTVRAYSNEFLINVHKIANNKKELDKIDIIDVNKSSNNINESNLIIKKEKKKSIFAKIYIWLKNIFNNKKEGN